MRCVLMVASGAAWESAALGRLDRHAATWWCSSAASTSTTCWRRRPPARPTSRWWRSTRPASTRPRSSICAVTRCARSRWRRAERGDAAARLPCRRDQAAAGRRPRRVGRGGDRPRRRRRGVARRSRRRPGRRRPAAGPAGGVADAVADEAPPVTDGRVVAVWGPRAPPGGRRSRSTLAAELAARGRRTVLVDADPYGGAVAQQLGVLDEVSGLLAAARLAAAGHARRAASPVCSAGSTRGSASSPGCRVPDRWVEVRAGGGRASAGGRGRRGARGGRHRLQPGGRRRRRLRSGRPARNAMTLAALGSADEVVVVGAADPVGLSRLARGLVELRDLAGGAPVHVVVNRSRSTLGWPSARSRGWSRGSPGSPACTSCPTTAPAVDRALVAGRTWSSWATGPCAAQSPSSSTRWSPTLGWHPAGAVLGWPPAGGSGGEQQVEPADGERHHRDQQRQLTGQLVPLRQQRDRPVVRGHDAEDVAGRPPPAPWCWPGASGGRAASSSPAGRRCRSRLLPLPIGSLIWIRVGLAAARPGSSGSGRRCSPRRSAPPSGRTASGSSPAPGLRTDPGGDGAER